MNYERTDGEAGDYRDEIWLPKISLKSTIIKWRILLNARQDMLRGMVIKDQFGDGLTWLKVAYAVRYAPV